MDKRKEGSLRKRLCKMISELYKKILRLFRKKKNIQLGFYGPVNAGKTTLANRISLDWLGKEIGKVSERLQSRVEGSAKIIT